MKIWFNKEFFQIEYNGITEWTENVNEVITSACCSGEGVLEIYYKRVLVATISIDGQAKYWEIHWNDGRQGEITFHYQFLSEALKEVLV